MIIVAMIILAIQVAFPDWDRELFLYLNSKSYPWLDPAMVLLSTYTAWTLVCALVILFMIYKDRIPGAIAGGFLLLGVAINTSLNVAIKWVIMRPRPGNDELLDGLVNLLEETGTTYSFFSGHSSNSICLAVFTTLYFRNKFYGIAIFAWAMAVAYSRIYVGKHYPLDVMAGIVFGLFSGWLAYWIYQFYLRKTHAPNPEQ